MPILSRIRCVETRLKTRYKVDEDGCWIWTGYTDGRYGLLSINNKEEKAHRVSYKFFKGEIEKGNSVHHSCDKTLCINPEHLSQGTHYENMQDMANKGRAFNGRTKLTYEERVSLIGAPISVIMEKGISESYASRIRRGIFKRKSEG